MSEPVVLAVRYASHASTRSEQFHRYAAYREPDGPMDLDYYVWVVRDGDDVVLVDTGFSAAGAAARPGRVTHLPAVEALRAAGVEPAAVSRIVVTHFHYDHIGNLAAFPAARLVVQARELAFWTGPYATRPAAAAGVEPAEIAAVVEAAQRGRVDVVDGAAAVTPAVSVDLVGGHCPGQQVVTVRAAREVVLCSDAVHFYAELEQAMPHRGVFDLEAMYRAYDTVGRAAAAGAVVVPGHDPAVMDRFPAVPGLAGVAVRVG